MYRLHAHDVRVFRVAMSRSSRQTLQLTCWPALIPLSEHNKLHQSFPHNYHLIAYIDGIARNRRVCRAIYRINQQLLLNVISHHSHRLCLELCFFVRARVSRFPVRQHKYILYIYTSIFSYTRVNIQSKPKPIRRLHRVCAPLALFAARRGHTWIWRSVSPRYIYNRNCVHTRRAQRPLCAHCAYGHCRHHPPVCREHRNARWPTLERRLLFKRN